MVPLQQDGCANKRKSSDLSVGQRLQNTLPAPPRKGSVCQRGPVTPAAHLESERQHIAQIQLTCQWVQPIPFTETNIKPADCKTQQVFYIYTNYVQNTPCN